MTHHIINLDAVPLEHHTVGEKFEARYGHVAPLVGAKQLGAGYHVVPPGKRAWPFHNHHINEELFVILAGEGVVRIGDRELPIRTGDIIAAPPGGRQTAHQIINTSGAELRYLCVSTMIRNEIVEYPDANKVAAYVGKAPGGDDGDELTFYFRGRLGEAAEYWDGE